MVGAGFMIVGAATSLFARELYHLYLTTMVSGLGASICCVLCFKLTSVAFSRKKLLATGLGSVGGGCGMITYAFLGSFAMQESGWKGFYYVLLGMSTLALFTALFVPASIRLLQSKRTLQYKQFTKDRGIAWSVSSSLRKLRSSFRRGFSLYPDHGFQLYAVVLVFYSFGAFFPMVFVVSRTYCKQRNFRRKKNSNFSFQNFWYEVFFVFSHSYSYLSHTNYAGYYTKEKLGKEHF